MSARQRLTPRERLILLKRVYKDRVSVTKACKEFGVSRFTFYELSKRYITEAGDEVNLKLLSDRLRRKKAHYRSISPNLQEKILELVYKNAEFSTHKLASLVPGVGNHGVQLLLEKIGLNTRESREKFTALSREELKKFLRRENVAIREYFSPEERLAIVQRIIEKKEKVAKVCQEVGISRFTFYRWLKLYEQDSSLEGLRNHWASGKLHYRALPGAIEQRILKEVVRNPVLSSRKLAHKIAGVGNHGVQNILERENLNRYELRLAYSQARRVVSKPVFAGFLDRVRYVLEQFVPSLAPAPPPEFRKLFKPFFISSFLVSLFSYGALSWFRIISQSTSFSNTLGLIFASLALLMGTFFFLYSFKYYITLALVLSFSQQEGTGGIGSGGGGSKGKGKGFLSWVLGLNGRGSASPEMAGGKAVGLTPNLEHVVLKRRPYVSIHIPFYNEKNVVERAIAASTNFDYPEYEVILCDDSTDETVDIIRNHQKKHLAKGERLKTIRNKEEGWELTEIEVRPGVTLKHLHRTSRSGFKGGALRLALTLVNPKTEFISVFDADFVPYPDTLELFLKYFQTTAGTLDFRNNDSKNSKHQEQSKRQTSNIAAVQGYQWHVLNKSENWITKGVRSEYAGSYVIERSGREIYGALKQISGAVYMIRRDVLEEVGWETSITEDFQLTLKLYEKGYKVVFTPYIQAPAECVSTLKRLIRQRMRWAEGHSNNVRKMFFRLLLNPKLTIAEKLEFLYLSPYYLQAFFFLVGTMSWLISETLFPARLPFWTSLWGWSLVLTNLLSLPLMNAVGLFLEESEERDYLGIASFFALSYIVVPFQAYSSLKGFLKGEGPWFRTPKTGKITDVLTRGTFYRFISGILPGRATPAMQAIGTRNLGTRAQSLIPNAYLSFSTANSQFNSFKVKPRRNRYMAKLVLFLVVGLSSIFSYFGNRVPQGAIVDFPIQARVEVIREDYSLVSQLTSILRPKESLASSTTFAETLSQGKSGNEIIGAALVFTTLLSLAFFLYLIRRKRRFFKKVLRPLFVLTLVLTWLLASWPPIWENPRFPPKINVAHAVVPAFEAGEVTVDDSLDWTTIYFSGVYSTAPVILATPVTANNCEAAGTCAGNDSTGGMYPIPLIRNVGTTSFDISMCVDGGNTTCDTGVSAETFHWFAFDVDDAGNYDWIEAGTTASVAVGGTATAETYSTSFVATPDVWTQAQTYSQGGNIGAHAWVVPKSASGFSYVGCVHTGVADVCDGTASTETFGYVAIDVTNENFDAALNFQSNYASIDDSLWTAASFSPTFTDVRVMVTQNSENGSQDPQYAWARNVTGSGMDFRYCEEDGGTTCNSHNAEDVFWFAVEEPVVAPNAPTLYNDDGGSNQIAFNNIKENDTTPIVRASATHSSTFDRFQVEFNTASNFGGTAYTETFSGTYSSGTAYNLQTTSSLNLPSDDGVTYYVRARASANGGTDYGSWSTTLACCDTWTYTYTSAGGDSEWLQTTDEQFDTGTLSSTQTSGSDSVELGGSATTVYLTFGTTWNVPANWNSSNNTIRAIGAGGDGGLSTASTNSGAGGGGGEYRAATNVTLTASSTVDINIPSGGAGSSADGAWIKNGAGGGGSIVVEGKNGGNASGVTVGAGGTGGTGTAANYDGGAGGAGASDGTCASGGGGGGSAGPSGIGKDGAAGGGGVNNAAGGGGGSNGGSSTAGGAYSGQTGGDGGDGYYGSGSSPGGAGGTHNNSNAQAGTNGGGGGGSGTATGGTAAPGANGSAENLWDTGVGPSGGGGGGGGASGSAGTADRDGGTGGTYSGGGGGCGMSGVTDTGECDGTGVGGQGIIVITYTTDASSGTIMSTVIDYDWFDNATAWNDVDWGENETNGTISVRVLGSNATDCDTQVIAPTATGPIDISGLTSTAEGQLHNRLCLEATLTDSGGTPYLEDWGVTVPEYSLLFLGIAPLLPGFIGRMRSRKRK